MVAAIGAVTVVVAGDMAAAGATEATVVVVIGAAVGGSRGSLEGLSWAALLIAGVTTLRPASASGFATNMKRIMRAFKLNEISAVDRPAQAHAKVVLMKRATRAVEFDKDGKMALHVSGELDKRDFNASDRRHDASTGAALPDGSFPIENAEDLANARRLVGHAKDPAAARAHIASRAKALGLAKLEELHLSGASIEEMEKAIEAFEPTETDMSDEDFKKAVAEAVTEATKEISEKLAKAEADLVKSSMDETERSYYDKADDAGKAAFAAMSADERKSTVAKWIDMAIPAHVQKQLAESEDLKKRLASLEQDKDISSFAKRASELGLEGHGETLRKAYSGEVESIGKLESILKGLAEQIRTGKVFAEFGSNQSGTGITASDEMNAAASAYRENQVKIGKRCSPQQAFTAVYTDPSNAELKSRYDLEDVKKRHAA